MTTKVENDCVVCRGLGWLTMSDGTIQCCSECQVFTTDAEAFNFVTTTTEQWQRTVALIFATRLVAEAVSVPKSFVAPSDEKPLSDFERGQWQRTEPFTRGLCPSCGRPRCGGQCQPAVGPSSDEFARSEEGQRRWPNGPVMPLVTTCQCCKKVAADCQCTELDLQRHRIKDADKNATCLYCGKINCSGQCAEHERERMDLLQYGVKDRRPIEARRRNITNPNPPLRS